MILTISCKIVTCVNKITFNKMIKYYVALTSIYSLIITCSCFYMMNAFSFITWKELIPDLEYFQNFIYFFANVHARDSIHRN